MPLFSSLSDDELKKTVDIIKENHYKHGDIIIKEDDLISANTFYIIHQCKIEVVKNYGDIEKLVIVTKESGVFFDEISLIDDQPRSATIRAATPTSIYEITRKDLNHILYSYPDLMYKIMKELSLGFRVSDKMLIENLKEKTGCSQMLMWKQLKSLSMPLNYGMNT